jgi:hypothetical protein
VLPIDVCDILVAEQPSMVEWHSTIWPGSCPDLKGEDYGMGSSAPLDTMFRIVLMLKSIRV